LHLNPLPMEKKHAKIFFYALSAILFFSFLFVVAIAFNTSYQKRVNQSSIQMHGLYETQRGSNIFSHVRHYHQMISSEIDDLEKLRKRISGNPFMRLFFPGKRKAMVEKSSTTIQLFQARNERIEELMNYVHRDIQQVLVHDKSTQEMEATLRESMTIYTPIEEIREFRNQISEQISETQKIQMALKANKTESVFTEEIDTIKSALYNNYDSTLTGIIERLERFDGELHETEVYYNEYFGRLLATTGTMLRQTQGFSAIMASLQGFSSEADRQVSQVRDYIRILEQPIGSETHGTMGPTPLSLIRAVNPTAGRAITSTRDLCDMILKVTGEVGLIINTLDPMRNAAVEFQHSPNRQNAMAVNMSAQAALQYLDRHKGLLSPVKFQIAIIKDEFMAFSRHATMVRNPRAKAILDEASWNIYTIILNLEKPVDIFESNFELTQNQFSAIAMWENEYIDRLSSINPNDVRVVPEHLAEKIQVETHSHNENDNPARETFDRYYQQNQRREMLDDVSGSRMKRN
jgi:hypothetical protein